MARIGGVNLPREKRMEAALTAIYGIGRQLSVEILEEAKIDKDLKVKDLSEEDAQKIRQLLEKIAIEGDLKRKIAMDVKRLQEIGSYRGFRHKKNLPARGQRTRYNARTKKGKKKTIANKKIVTK